MTIIKQIGFVLAVSGVMLVGAGCAQQTAVTPNTTPTPSPTAPAPVVAPTPTTSPSTTPPPTGQVTPPKPATAPTAKPAPAPVRKPSAAVPANRTQFVTMTGGAYSPQVLAVAVGDTVVWTNKDTVNHTTVSDNALLWDSGNLKPGASYSHVFKAPGSYVYHCAIHPSMTGTIVVYAQPK